MEPVVSALLRKVAADELGKTDALLYLALLLELKTKPVNMIPMADGRGFYESNLPCDLASVSLDDAAQKEIVEYICEVIRKGRKDTPSLLWAIGKGLPTVVIEPLLRLLLSHSSNLTEEAIVQGIWSLDNCIIIELLEGEGRLVPAIADGLKRHNPESFLERMTKSSNNRVAGAAQSLRERLARLTHG